MIDNSIGNLTEIFRLLDSYSFTGAELAENYAYLIEKWGEWVIIGGTGGVEFRFVDVRAAFFSGLAITFLILTLVSLVLAVAIGKILLPQLSKMYTARNEFMVDIATLQTQADVSSIKEKEKGWYGS